jgi:hypothetical protein
MHLLRIAELPKEMVVVVVQGEQPESIVVEAGNFGVNTSLDKFKYVLGQLMT